MMMNILIVLIAIGAIIAMFISAAIWKRDREKDYYYRCGCGCFYESNLEAALGKFLVSPISGGLLMAIGCLIIYVINWWLIPMILVILIIIFIVYSKDIKKFIKEKREDK